MKSWVFWNLGEMIVGPRKTLFMDEISTGLDSSTTFQIVKCIGNFVHQLEATVLMSLLQPPPETFNLFDDVILLSGGLIIYQGPIEHVVKFFESIGFCLPPRKGIADFLQEVHAFFKPNWLVILLLQNQFFLQIFFVTFGDFR